MIHPINGWILDQYTYNLPHLIIGCEGRDTFDKLEVTKAGIIQTFGDDCKTHFRSVKSAGLKDARIRRGISEGRTLHREPIILQDCR